jgi:hypothetical protein
MKKYIVLLLTILFTSHAFSQKKGKQDAKDLKIDSLTKVTDTLSAKLDTVSKDRAVYYGLYTTIKEKVLKRDFDPASLSQIIDSLAAKRDSTFSSMLSSAALADSISVLKHQIADLSTLLGGTKAQEETLNSMTIRLKQLKELLDANILTQSEFEMMKLKVLHSEKL